MLTGDTRQFHVSDLSTSLAYRVMCGPLLHTTSTARFATASVGPRKDVEATNNSNDEETSDVNNLALYVSVSVLAVVVVAMLIIVGGIVVCLKRRAADQHMYTCPNKEPTMKTL